jgi:hypothetical protein
MERSGALFRAMPRQWLKEFDRSERTTSGSSVIHFYRGGKKCGKPKPHDFKTSIQHLEVM